MESTFLVLLALLTVHASTVPTTPALSLPNSIAAISAFDGSVVCDDVSLEHEILRHDCNIALALLPVDVAGDVRYNSHIHQYVYPEFSRASTEERHRLPKTAEAGSCIVEVRLAPNAHADNTSWRIIALRVGNVFRRCVELELGAGGRTVTGESKHIEIFVCSPHGSMSEIQHTGNRTAAITSI